MKVFTLKNSLTIVVSAVIAVFALTGSYAEAATLNVPSDHATLAGAVAAASAGDTITIDAGSYDSTSQVVVDKNLTVIGSGKDVTILTTSFDTTTSGNGRGWILVEPNVTLHLSDLTMDGNGQKVWQAVRNTGDGSVDNVHFTNITFFSNGVDGSPYAGTAYAAFGTGPVDVTNSDFDNIGRIGMHYFGDGPDGSVFADNTYVGKGVGDYLDYALDVGSGPDVTIVGNTISNNRGEASSDGSTSAAILVSTFFGGETSALIENNHLFNNTTGIAVGFDGNDVSSVEAHNNCIVGNEFGINSTAPEVDAENNWWGSADGPSGSGPGSGDSADSEVDFDPWLTEPAAPCAEPDDGDTDVNGDTSIRTSNRALIFNSTDARSNTGFNWAGGAEGGNGGNGGDIDNDGDGEVKDSSTGNGGAGGNAGTGSGGQIVTGNANADAGTANIVNSTDVRVTRNCGCTIDGDDNSNARVRTYNRAFLWNGTDADAGSGHNAAGGAEGGSGGNGGDVDNDEDGDGVDSSHTGSGGRGGNAGEGGLIRTGSSNAASGVLNDINRTLIRITR